MKNALNHDIFELFGVDNQWVNYYFSWDAAGGYEK